MATITLHNYVDDTYFEVSDVDLEIDTPGGLIAAAIEHGVLDKRIGTFFMADKKGRPIFHDEPLSHFGFEEGDEVTVFGRPTTN